MINALWRLTLTIIFLLSLALILAIVWEVPAVLGYTLPAELVKLPTTLLILLAMVTGIWGTWSRPATIRKTIEDQKPAHTTQGDTFATPNSDLRHEDMSMIEKANQTTSK